MPNILKNTVKQKTTNKIDCARRMLSSFEGKIKIKTIKNLDSTIARINDVRDKTLKDVKDFTHSTIDQLQKK